MGREKKIQQKTRRFSCSNQIYAYLCTYNRQGSAILWCNALFHSWFRDYKPSNFERSYLVIETHRFHSTEQKKLSTKFFIRDKTKSVARDFFSFCVFFSVWLLFAGWNWRARYLNKVFFIRKTTNKWNPSNNIKFNWEYGFCYDHIMILTNYTLE